MGAIAANTDCSPWSYLLKGSATALVAIKTMQDCNHIFQRPEADGNTGKRKRILSANSMAQREEWWQSDLVQILKLVTDIYETVKEISMELLKDALWYSELTFISSLMTLFFNRWPMHTNHRSQVILFRCVFFLMQVMFLVLQASEDTALQNEGQT